MKRSLLSVGFLLAAIATALPAAAEQFSSTPSCKPMVNAPRQLPPIPCFNGPTSWNDCNSFAQYIDNYNHWVQIVNEVNDLKCKANEYWNYPASAAAHINEDLNEAADILTRANALSFKDKNLDQEIQQMWPDYNPGYSPQQLDDHLDAITNNSILGVLKAAGALQNHTERDANVVESIKTAAANAKNPTQATQMTVQLLSVMYEQMVKQQQFAGLKLSQDAEHDMVVAARERQTRMVSEQNGVAQARMMYPVPPKLSSQQLQQLQESWNH
jgi:P-type conjugative transfer protein TrbJ